MELRFQTFHFTPMASPAFARILAAFQLMAPATAMTAAADTAAGLTVALEMSAGEADSHMVLLLLAAVLLQAGCAAWSDGWPPSGQDARRLALSWRGARWFSLTLQAAGIALAAAGGSAALLFSLAISALVLLPGRLKRPPLWLDAVSQGLGRSGTLLLGMAADPVALFLGWPLAVIPLAYVATLAVIGRGEQEGRNPAGVATLGIFVLVAIAYGFLAISRQQWSALLFVALYAAWSWPAFVQAAEAPSKDSIRNAVQTGMLNLVVCDAALAAAFAGPMGGLAILLFLPAARGLSRLVPTA